jgi:hypothetical protein
MYYQMKNNNDENRMKYIKGVIVETRNIAFTRKLNDIPIPMQFIPIISSLFI